MEREAIAYNYYTSIEKYGLDGLDSSLWVSYIQMGNELHKKNVKVKKCARRLKQNHTYLSDYFFNKIK
jgi:hypothetical protein